MHQPIVERFNEPAIVFLTVCTQDRKRILATADVVALLRDSWRDAQSWLVGRYVVMPDHLHLFCAPATLHGTDGNSLAGVHGTDGAVPSRPLAGLHGTGGAVRSKSLGQWVRYWKTLASRRWPRPAEQPVWQLDFWDTQLRRLAHYDEKWEYVRQNPVRAGLVEVPEAWPHQGELNELRW